MARAVLITGGNAGEVRANLDAARDMIAGRVGAVVAASSVRESEPWGAMEEGAGAFLNQVLVVETPLGPQELLGAVLGIERELGRERPAGFCAELRDAAVRRYASRTMDIDILFYDDMVIESAGLTIPHPLIAAREFVLAPLAEVLPDLVHPVSGKTAGQMLAEIAAAARERT